MFMILYFIFFCLDLESFAFEDFVLFCLFESREEWVGMVARGFGYSVYSRGFVVVVVVCISKVGASAEEGKDRGVSWWG